MGADIWPLLRTDAEGWELGFFQVYLCTLQNHGRLQIELQVITKTQKPILSLYVHKVRNLRSMTALCPRSSDGAAYPSLESFSTQRSHSSWPGYQQCCQIGDRRRRCRVVPLHVPDSKQEYPYARRHRHRHRGDAKTGVPRTVVRKHAAGPDLGVDRLACAAAARPHRACA